MKTKKTLIFFVSVCLSLILFSRCGGKTKSDGADKKVLTEEQLIQRGNYLVTISGCHDCHSPKRMGPQGPEDIQELFLSGYQANAQLPPIEKTALQKGWMLFTGDLNGFVGPWGISFAANITSDQTGIGNWPEENFIRALREGKYKGIEGSRMLLPPMPWQNLAKATDDDLKAFFAFLKTTKPIKNAIPMAIAPTDIK
jgi:hypothetical protein